MQKHKRIGRTWMHSGCKDVSIVYIIMQKLYNLVTSSRFAITILVYTLFAQIFAIVFVKSIQIF